MVISGIAAVDNGLPESVLDEGWPFNECQLVLREDVVKRWPLQLWYKTG